MLHAPVTLYSEEQTKRNQLWVTYDAKRCISTLMYTTRFYNNIHQVHSSLKDWKALFWASKSKGLYKIAKIS